MRLPVLDVTAEARAAGCGAPCVVVSLGTIGAVASPDPTRRATLVGMLCRQILEGEAERREIDETHWAVTVRSKSIYSARTFVVVRLDRPDGPVLAILAGFELEITEGEYSIEVFERRAAKAQVLN